MTLPSPREPRRQQRAMGDMSHSPAEGGPRSERADGTLPSGQYWQGWPVQAPAGVIVLVHGVHEHSGRYHHVAERLSEARYAVYAVDHPGHGRSPGTRGNIDSMAAAVHGVGMLAGMAGQRHPGVPLFVYGHSLGGLIALQYLTGTPDERIRGGVLSSPALDTSVATGAQKLAALLLSRLLPDAGVAHGDLDTISRDQEVVQAFRADALNYTGKVRARTAAEVLLAVSAMPQRLASLRLPLLVLHGSADRLIPPAASEVVRANAGSPDLTVKIYDGLYHELHNEPEQQEVLDGIVAWLDAHLDALSASPGSRGRSA